MNSLTIGQKKALVLAYIFGGDEINSITYRALLKKGLIYDSKLSAQAIQFALALINNPKVNV